MDTGRTSERQSGVGSSDSDLDVRVGRSDSTQNDLCGMLATNRVCIVVRVHGYVEQPASTKGSPLCFVVANAKASGGELDHFDTVHLRFLNPKSQDPPDRQGLSCVRPLETQ